ncbi:MAG TPA: cytochrome c/FTR1 family iron permease [Gammaproteobacteria bacterium]
MNITRSLPRLCALLALIIITGPVMAAGKPEVILHMLDYIRVDYPATVQDGKVVNSGEYVEMQEFSSQVAGMVRALEPRSVTPQLLSGATRLQQAIDERAASSSVNALVHNLSQQLIASYPVNVSPRLPPSVASGKQLYADNCASCHGISGNGLGPEAATLSPPPVNFQDMARQQERSVWGLYSAISQGVEGTAMTAYDNFSKEQRWALAFYVSSFAFSDSARNDGRELWNNSAVQGWIPDLASLTALTPAEVKQQYGEDGVAVLAYLRSSPAAIASGQGALSIAAQLLATSLQEYRNEYPQEAYQLALSAYLDGFELGEAALSSTDPGLTRSIEQAMLAYREMIRAEAPLNKIQQQYETVTADLQRASTALNENTMTASMGFVSAYVILLREGLEAILLLGAITAVLLKLGRRDTLPYLHAGWIGALVLGGATWAVSNYLFRISGAGRELTEGLTALLACGVVLYVGFWLHDKTHATRWREFVDGKVRHALNGKNLWLLTFIAFIAVYREVFETVLFYQALWLQAEPGSEPSLWGGILAAVFSLLALGWIILRSSIRLPLKLVFRVNAAILFILAVVFAGHGVAALQEAGWLPVDLIAMPSFELLGIYPTLETLGAQLLVVALVSMIFLRQRQPASI